MGEELGVASSTAPQLRPVLAQRRHWYPYVMPPVPLPVPPQVPGFADSVWLSWVGPETLGAERSMGTAWTAAPELSSTAYPIPAEFVALTISWSRHPTSVALTVYDLVVAPGPVALLQVAPVATSQSCHW